MSYDIAVWYSSKAVTEKEALAHYQKLCDGKIDAGESSPNVRKFLTQLKKIYPNLDSTKGDESPWSCDPTVSKHHVALSMTFSSVSEVVPTVTALAATHGLVCYDPQTSQVVNPGDRTETQQSFLDMKEHAKQRRARAKEFEKDILDRIGGKLVANGFDKRACNHYVFEVSAGIRGVMVLSTIVSSAEGYSEVKITPYIGLCCDEFNRVYKELWPEENFDPYERSFGANYGYVTRQRGCHQWQFVTHGNIDRGIDDLVRSITEHGIAFYRAYSTRDSVFKEIIGDKFGTRRHPEPVVALALLGKRQEAREFMNKRFEEIIEMDPHGYLAEGWRIFVERFGESPLSN